jgi:hypothetical protein
MAPLARAVDRRDRLVDATPLLRRVSPTSQLLRVAPSLCLASVLSSLGVVPLDFSLCIEATGSHVPHKGLVQVHATSMPDVAQAGCRLRLDLSRSNDSSRFRHHPYAFDTFPVVHSLRLPVTSPDAVSAAPFPSTLTTPALDRSSSWWFGACLCRPARGALPHPLCSKAASKLAATSRPPFRAVVAHGHPRT